jgi:hypothetical protein
MQGPGIGLGMGAGGMPRVNLSGDFNPRTLFKSVVSGEGFEKPRIVGLVFMALSIAFWVGNFVLIAILHIWFPYLVIISYPMGAGGFWLLVSGQPKRTADGSPAVMWGRIGLGIFLVLGILGGFSNAFLLARPF